MKPRIKPKLYSSSISHWKQLNKMHVQKNKLDHNASKEKI